VQGLVHKHILQFAKIVLVVAVAPDDLWMAGVVQLERIGPIMAV
jgi:hypothetical protein